MDKLQFWPSTWGGIILLEINADDILLRSEEQTSCDLDEEKVILSIKNGMYYSMTKIGAVIWDLLAEPMTFSRLQQALLKRFDVTEEQCNKDSSEFLSDLQQQGLLQISRQQ